MTNFENLKADIQKMTIAEFVSTAKGIIYYDCKFCNYVEDKEKCKNSEFLCSDGVREWLESEAEEQHYNLYANALLSDGKLLFWRTGRDKCKSIYDFYKDFYYADIDIEDYEKEHTLTLACKTFEVYNDDDNERIFDTDSVKFYKQYELSSDFSGDTPW